MEQSFLRSLRAVPLLMIEISAVVAKVLLIAALLFGSVEGAAPF